jgi:hypothetical protein
MTIEQRLQSEIQESERWIECTQDECTYKRDLTKRIELLNWVLENIKNPEINICELIESKMNEIIDMVNKLDSVIEADPLHRDLRILDWILYQVCINEK